MSRLEQETYRYMAGFPIKNLSTSNFLKKLRRGDHHNKYSYIRQTSLQCIRKKLLRILGACIFCKCGIHVAWIRNSILCPYYYATKTLTIVLFQRNTSKVVTHQKTSDWKVTKTKHRKHRNTIETTLMLRLQQN